MSPRRIPSVCFCGVRACETHRRKQDPRPSAYRRGYDRQWRALREQVLAGEPLCRMCAERGRVTPAVEVHHTMPVRRYPHLRLVHDGLVPLCKPCHSSINDYDDDTPFGGDYDPPPVHA